jgi:hypothetical protein
VIIAAAMRSRFGSAIKPQRVHDSGDGVVHAVDRDAGAVDEVRHQRTAFAGGAGFVERSAQQVCIVADLCPSVDEFFESGS